MPPSRRAVRNLPDVPLTRKTCPACRQEQDRYAQGVIELRGRSWKEKRDLVERTIRNSERIARSRNDQERVLWMESSREVARVFVTLPELARRIGRELQRSFHGESEYVRSSEEPFLRVRWWSDGAPEEDEERRSRAFRGRGKS